MTRIGAESQISPLRALRVKSSPLTKPEDFFRAKTRSSRRNRNPKTSTARLQAKQAQLSAGEVAVCLAAKERKRRKMNGLK